MNVFEHNPMAEYLIQQGIQQERIAFLCSLARKRFPHTSEATLQLLRELDAESLQQIKEAILDLPDGRSFRHLLLQLKQQSTPSS